MEDGAWVKLMFNNFFAFCEDFVIFAVKKVLQKNYHWKVEEAFTRHATPF